MGRILEYVDAAQESIRFTIFAFTKDQVGSAYIRKQEQFARWDEEDGVDIANTPFRERRSVAGMIDQSQLHSRTVSTTRSSVCWVPVFHSKWMATTIPNTLEIIRRVVDGCTPKPW